jgi:hypothetical protein
LFLILGANFGRISFPQNDPHIWGSFWGNEISSKFDQAIKTKTYNVEGTT